MWAYSWRVIAVILFAVAVFMLGVVAVLSAAAAERRLVLRALALAAALVVVAAGLAIAGAARYTLCVRTTSGAHNCPTKVLGIRDPFSP